MRVLARLLLDALMEAPGWGIPKVRLRRPSPFTLWVVQLLSDMLGPNVKNKERARKGVPMIRWRVAANKKNIMIRSHEVYARG